MSLTSSLSSTTKALMQEVWLAVISWDDILPNDLIAKWQRWVSELHKLSHITIPRSLRLPNPSHARLHVFSDASKEAFATVAYLVCRYPDGNTSSRIIAPKSRVAPTKAVTIPRLELMGAVLSVRLAKRPSTRPSKLKEPSSGLTRRTCYTGFKTKAVSSSPLLPTT